MQVSKKGVDLIKLYEGRRLEAYQDIAGIWTVGYGHTGPDVYPGQRITEKEAERLLRKDLASHTAPIVKSATRQMTQQQFDAFASLCFNIGAPKFLGSTAFRRFNLGDDAGAAVAITWWNKARVNNQLEIVEGLVRRRADEAEVYLYGDYERSDDGVVDAPGATADIDELVRRRAA